MSSMASLPSGAGGRDAQVQACSGKSQTTLHFLSQRFVSQLTHTGVQNVCSDTLRSNWSQQEARIVALWCRGVEGSY